MSHHKLLQPRGSRYFILVSKLQFRLRGPQLDGSVLRRKAHNKISFFPTLTCGVFLFSAVSAPHAASRPAACPPSTSSLPTLPHHSLTLTYIHHTHTHSSLSHHISSLSHTHTYTHLITHHHSHTHIYTYTHLITHHHSHTHTYHHSHSLTHTPTLT